VVLSTAWRRASHDHRGLDVRCVTDVDRSPGAEVRPTAQGVCAADPAPRAWTRPRRLWAGLLVLLLAAELLDVGIDPDGDVELITRDLEFFAIDRGGPTELVGTVVAPGADPDVLKPGSCCLDDGLAGRCRRVVRGYVMRLAGGLPEARNLRGREFLGVDRPQRVRNLRG